MELLESLYRLRLKTVVSGSLANLAGPVSTLITGPLLARSLGPDGRGLMAELLAPLALANLMFTLGVPDALTYFVAGGKLAGPTSRRLALHGGLICSAVAMVTFFLAAPSLFRNQTQALPFFYPLLLSLPLTLYFSAVRGIAQGRQRFSSVNKERTAGALLRLAVLCMLAVLHVLTPMAAVWASVLSGVAGSFFLLPALRSFNWQSPVTGRMMPITRYAATAAMGTVGGLIIIRLDQVLMVSLTSRAELAFYAVAASIAEVPLAVVSACRDLAFSLAATENDPQVIARFCRLTLAAVTLICIMAGLLIPVVVPLLFGKSFSPAIQMTEILLLATIGRSVTAVIGAGLMTTGRSWLRSGLQLSGALLTAVLIFVFVPRWGGTGAAWVTTFTYGLLALASLILYARATGVGIRECIVPRTGDFRKLLS